MKNLPIPHLPHLPHIPHLSHLSLLIRHGRGICAILACAVIAGCASGDRMGNAETSGMSGTAGNTASGYAGGRSNATGAMGAPASAMGDPARKAKGMAMQQGRPDAAMAGWQGVVQAIDPVTRQDAAIGVSGAPGAAAVGGTIPGMGTDRVYRVTLRTDDGSMQSVVVEATPDYKVGDRVSYSNGSISRQ